MKDKSYAFNYYGRISQGKDFAPEDINYKHRKVNANTNTFLDRIEFKWYHFLIVALFVNIGALLMRAKQIQDFTKESKDARSGVYDEFYDVSRIGEEEEETIEEGESVEVGEETSDEIDSQVLQWIATQEVLDRLESIKSIASEELEASESVADED